MKLSSFVKAPAYWGKLEWDNPRCSHFVLRIDNLLRYREQLIHLYASLGDNCSNKIILTAANDWPTDIIQLLLRTFDHEPCWFDTDLITIVKYQHINVPEECGCVNV